MPARNSRFRKITDQRGLASIIIVFTLIIVVALISLGFSRLMNRSLQNTVNSQLSAAADFAAQSGINDAAAWVQANPTQRITDCQEQLTDSGGLKFANQAVADLSGNQIVRYTCVLVEPEPADIVYGDLPTNKSQVVRLTTSAPLTSVMFSWQSYDLSKRNFVGSGSALLDEAQWGTQGYAPLLRVSLFPVDATGAILNPKSFFLYPNGSNSPVVASNFQTTASGTKLNGNCSTNPSKDPGGFNGTADFDCNVVITGLVPPAGGYYYARLTPVYDQADVKIQGNSNGSVVKFLGVQSVVDVTAKANDAVKRLQGRVQTSDQNNINPDDNNFPEDAIRSANTLCKRIIVPDSNPSILGIDGASITNSPACSFVDITLPPVVTLTANPTTVTQGSSSTLTWTVAGDPASDCTASGDWSGAKAVSGGSQSSGALNTVRTYSFTLTCTNAAGSDSDTVTVNVLPPPPVVTLTANPTSVSTGGSSILTWTTTNSPTTCTASGDWSGAKAVSGGSESTGALNVNRAYNYTLTCTNAGGSGSDTATVVVLSFPPPPPPGAPTVNLTANPVAVATGGSSTLFWSTTNSPTSCTASVDWSGAKAVSGGSQSTGALNTNRTYTYTLTCTNPSGSGSDTATVAVSPSPPPPPPSSCANPAGGGDGNQDPCIWYFTASRQGDNSVRFAFRADACGSSLTLSYPGGSQSLPPRDGNGADPEVVVVPAGSITSAAGSASLDCQDNRPVGGWSSASASFGPATGPPSPPIQPPFPPPPPIPPPDTGPREIGSDMHDMGDGSWCLYRHMDVWPYDGFVDYENYANSCMS